jgi:hypothetical protein
MQTLLLVVEEVVVAQLQLRLLHKLEQTVDYMVLEVGVVELQGMGIIVERAEMGLLE